MGRKKRAERFGSEEQKVRNGAVAVLEPELEPMVKVSPRAEEIPPRPPKPEGEDVTPCPNWDKGAYERERTWFRCQGWTLNGHEVCKNCHKFSQMAPKFRSVSRDTLMNVLGNAKRAFDGVHDGLKDTKEFKAAWLEFVSIVDSVTDEGGRDYSPLMRRIEVLIPRLFAEEVTYLSDKCQSLFRTRKEITVTLNERGVTRRVTLTHEDMKSSAREWKKEVDKEERRAEIEGEFPRWNFAGKLRFLCSAISKELTYQTFRNEVLQEPSRAGNGRNGGNGGNSGWNPNNGWVPRR